MKNKSYGIYCISVLLLVIAASVYPIIMGARILADWLPDGIVAAADYPKYVISYTPLSLALIAGTALLPLFVRYLKKWATPAASALSLGIFFAAEHFLEGLTVEADISGLIMVPNVTENVDLGNWQMYMCAITPPRVSYEIGIEPIDFSKTQVGILAGEYSPAFKLHFYLISTVLIIAITGCIYGFGQMLKSGDRLFFSRGMLIGTGTLPVTMIVGGLLSGLSFLQIVLQSLPVLLFCFLLMFGIWRFPEQTVRAFTVFADVIRLLTTIGLIAGAFCYMTGFSLLPDLAPLEDAMAVVSSIGIVLLGSLPTAELLQRVLKKPLSFIGRKTGMNDSSAAGLLMGIVSPVPAITMMEKMDERGKIVNATFLVSAASTIAAHMGFTFGTDPDFVVPLLVAKLAGGIAAVCAALFFTKNSA